jgi:ornithine--oxo-acid transaminase
LSGRLIDQESRYGAPNDPPLEAIFTRADGVYLWDLDGNRYLDFLSAQATVNQGHNHTRIAAAMVEQCLRLCLTSRDCRNDRLPPLLEKLCSLTGFDRALLLSSGSEAVDAALKAARRWGQEVKGIRPGRAEVLAFNGNYHGHTTSLLGCGDGPGQAGFGPFAPGFRVLPYGDLAALDAAMGPGTCAVLVEPVQGEAGVVLPPRGFLRGLRELCDRHRVLLIADEVQSGMGRTGRLLAFEHEGIRPDGAAVGKALSGGFYPVSAFLASEELMAMVSPGDQGGTFGGNPLACAVASAALDVLVEERLIDHAAELGAYLQERLRSLDSPRIRGVRGLGLWAGIELQAAPGEARELCAALRREGLLCRETHGRTLHLAPPLVITREQLDWGLGRLSAVLAG